MYYYNKSCIIKGEIQDCDLNGHTAQSVEGTFVWTADPPGYHHLRGRKVPTGAIPPHTFEEISETEALLIMMT